MSTVVFPFDPTGSNPANRVSNEQQVVTSVNGRDYHFIVPRMAPFFAESLQLTFRNPDGSIRPMVEGVDYYFTHHFISASRACAKPIYGSITFLNNQMSGVATLTYQTLGGIWTLDDNEIAQILANQINNPRTTAWEQITNMPIMFPVIDHEWNLVDMVGMSAVVEGIDRVTDAILSGVATRGSYHTLPAQAPLPGNPEFTWAKLGVLAPQPPNLRMNDLYWRIAGGDSPNAVTGAMYTLQAGIRGQAPQLRMKSEFSELVHTVKLGYVYDPATNVLTLYLRMGNGSNPLTVTNLQPTGSSVVLQFLGAVEPDNINYITLLE
jgi:hypothetical protein